jgi:hypothetical protein
MILRISSAQRRVFTAYGLEKRLGVDASKPMVIVEVDRIIIRETLTGIGRNSCYYRSAAAILRKLEGNDGTTPGTT